MIRRRTIFWICGIIVIIVAFFLYQSVSDKKEKVYILYNVQKEKSPWEGFRDLFPEDFRPRVALYNIEELAKLTEPQHRLLDSLAKVIYAQPRLLTSKEENVEYYLDLGPYTTISLKREGKSRHLSFERMSELNFISPDSVVSLTSGFVGYTPELEIGRDLELIVVVPDSLNKRAELISVDPQVVEWD